MMEENGYPTKQKGMSLWRDFKTFPDCSETEKGVTVRAIVFDPPMNLTLPHGLKSIPCSVLRVMSANVSANDLRKTLIIRKLGNDREDFYISQDIIQLVIESLSTDEQDYINFIC